MALISRTKPQTVTLFSVSNANVADVSAPQKMSSFTRVPAVVLTGVGIRLLDNGLGRWLCCHGTAAVRASQAAAMLFAGSNAAAVEAAADVAQVVATGRGRKDSDRSLVAPVWVTVQAYVFRDGSVSASAYLAAAVVLHQARRTLWPRLGSYVLPDAGEDWRLVLARPDVFLEQAVAAAPWPRQLASSAQKRAVDVIAGGGCALLLAADDSVLAAAVQRGIDAFLVLLQFLLPLPPRRVCPALARTVMRRAKDVAAVVFLLWLFSCIEYAVVRVFNAGALAYAAVSLLAGAGAAEAANRALLGRLLSRSSASAALLAWSQLVAYPAWGIFPLLSTAVRAAVGRRQPGLLIAIFTAAAALYILLRYRSRLYIAIETGGLFAVLAFAALSGLLVLANACSRQTQNDSTLAGVDGEGKKKR